MSLLARSCVSMTRLIGRIALLSAVRARAQAVRVLKGGQVADRVAETCPCHSDSLTKLKAGGLQRDRHPVRSLHVGTSGQCPHRAEVSTFWILLTFQWLRLLTVAKASVEVQRGSLNLEALLLQCRESHGPRAERARSNSAFWASWPVGCDRGRGMAVSDAALLRSTQHGRHGARRVASALSVPSARAQLTSMLPA